MEIYHNRTGPSLLIALFLFGGTATAWAAPKVVKVERDHYSGTWLEIGRSADGRLTHEHYQRVGETTQREPRCRGCRFARIPLGQTDASDEAETELEVVQGEAFATP